MRSIRVLISFAAAVAFVAACESTTEAKVQYGASLTGAKERPTAVTTSGTGTFTATVSGGSTMTFTLSFHDLSSDARRVFIQGPASDTDTAAVILDLNNMPVSLGTGGVALGDTGGTGAGTIDLTHNVAVGFSGDSLRRLMDAGLLYINIITASDSITGEIRGQITKQ